MAISYSKLGETHAALGQLDTALTFYIEYHTLGKELYEAYPNNVEFKNNLALSYQGLGYYYGEHKQDSKSEKLQYIESEKLLSELVVSSPLNANLKKI